MWHKVPYDAVYLLLAGPLPAAEQQLCPAQANAKGESRYIFPVPFAV